MQLSVRERRPDAGSTVLGRYRLGEVIGRGGMSTVYRGLDATTGAPVAIKLVAPHLSHDEGYRRRLLDEARAVSRLPHPHIVRLIDWGAGDDGNVVLVLELIEGETLQQRLQRGPLPVEQAVRVAQQIAEALACAHAHGVVHRDVKPHNILLHPTAPPTGDHGAPLHPEHGSHPAERGTPNAAPFPARTPDFGLQTSDFGPGLVAKLVDFGIARTEDALDHTSTGVVMGSAPYLAPELLQGQPASPQSDLYALGVTLFQMLTGHLPFEAATAAESLTRRLMADAPRLRTLLPIAPRWLDDVVASLLAGDPAQRPPDAARLATRLGQGDAPTGRALPRWEWRTRPVRVARSPKAAPPARTARLVRAAHVVGAAQPVAAARPALARVSLSTAAPRSQSAPSTARRSPLPSLFERIPEQQRLPAAALGALIAVFLLLVAGAAAQGSRHAQAGTPDAGQVAGVTVAGTAPEPTAAPAAVGTAAPIAAPTEEPTPTVAPPPALQVRVAPAPKKGKRR